MSDKLAYSIMHADLDEYFESPTSVYNTVVSWA